MKTRIILALSLTALFLVLLLALSTTTAKAAAVGTEFLSFQARIYEGNAPANGVYDFEFRLFDERTNGVQAGSLVSISNAPVANGFFHASLDFGPDVFTGEPRWLEIQQRVSGTGAFVTLSNRVPLLSTPHAIFAFSASNAAVASSVSAGGITPAAMGAGSVNSVAIADGSVCAEDLCTNLLDHTFWRLLGNADTVPGTHFLGTIDNKALTIRVNNTPALRLLPDPSAPGPDATAHSILGGYLGNFVHPNVRAVTIAGGGALIDPVFGGSDPGRNMIDNGGDFSFLGGGAANYISGTRNAIVGGHYNRMTNGNSSVIGGGEQNLITFLPGNISNTSLDWGVIGGGSENTLIFAADGAFIGAGHNNTATNFSAFIGAGEWNLAGGAYSVIAGGRTNRALGESSVIAGGTSNTVSGLGSSIGGGQRNYVISANSTVAGGFANTNLASFAAIGGGNMNRANGLASAIAGGSGNVVNGAYSTLGGGNGNSVNGPASMVGGGTSNRVDASASVIAGGQLNYIGGATNAVAAILGGNANTNLGSSAAIAGGERNLALGAWSAIPGGKQAIARSHGELAFAGGQLDTQGDAQVSTFVLRRRFTGNGDLFLDGNAGLQRISVPNGAVWTLRFQVSAVSVTGTNFASYEVSGMVANIGGTVTFQMVDGPGVPMATTARPIFETAGAVGWLATPYVTGTPGDSTLRIAVFAGEEVKWCARIDATEVTR